MQLTTCYLAGLLAEAKEAHTRYEERFAIEGVKPPEHKWEDWYARFIMQRIKDREYNELFAPVDVTCAIAAQPVEQPAQGEYDPKWHAPKRYLSVG